jgi:hypothetical protein
MNKELNEIKYKMSWKVWEIVNLSEIPSSRRCFE